MNAVDEVLARGVETEAVAGVVAVAVTPTECIYEGAFGIGALQSGEPISTSSLFWIMSLTKALTATACMQLIEQGRIGLDQPAFELVSGLAEPQVLDGFAPDGEPMLRNARRPITIRHLLTHTSGFSYPLWSEKLSRYVELTGLPDAGSGQLAALHAPLEFDPGDRWSYGIGLDWVGRIIEQVSGQTLDAYFSQHIFEPLGMPDSGFILHDDRRQHMVSLHRRQPDGSLLPEAFEMPRSPEFFMGGAAAFSTPRDFSRFLQALLSDGILDNRRILRPASVAAMFSNQIGDVCVEEMRSTARNYSLDCDFFPGQKHKWGLSFDLNLHEGPDGRSGGSGSWAGLLNCFFWVDRPRQVAAAMFTQMLPFCDSKVMQLYGSFERELYRSLDA